jgi:hypothetical protein
LHFRSFLTAFSDVWVSISDPRGLLPGTKFTFTRGLDDETILYHKQKVRQGLDIGEFKTKMCGNRVFLKEKNSKRKP